MDIGALSVSMSAASLSMNMGVAMLDKILDTAEVTGEVLTEMMMESIPVAGLGEYIDFRV